MHKKMAVTFYTLFLLSSSTEKCSENRQEHLTDKHAFESINKTVQVLYLE